jgi:hypothetical protein
LRVRADGWTIGIGHLRPKGTFTVSLRYDDIKKGRRRDWDKLQNPEEKRRREQEKLEQDPEYQKSKSALKMMEERRKNEIDEGKEEWVRLKRKLRWRVGAVLAVALILMAWQLTRVYNYHHSLEKQLQDSDLLVMQRVEYSKYNDPADAFVSWRSAWARSDLQDVIRTDSPRRLKRLYGEGNVALRLADLHRRGVTGDVRKVALNFGRPELVRLPERPYQSQELAVFKSGRIVLRTPQSVAAGRGGEVTRDRWVAAFVWEPSLREWRLEELRPDHQWDDSWRIVPQILSPAEYQKRKNEAKKGEVTEAQP